MESAACGCATITTDRGGLKETFKTNLTLRNLSYLSLEKMISKIIRDKNTYSLFPRRNIMD